MNSENEKKRGTRSSQKRGIIIAFSVMAAIVLIWYVVIPAVNALIERSKKTDGETSDYMDRIVSYRFYPTNYSEDIFADEEYMSKERGISYKDGGDTYLISDGNYSQYGPAVVLFSEYFDDVINGRCDEIDKYFSDEYFENQKNKEKFTPQKIYDIELELVSSETNEGSTTYVFLVGFKIFRNNGSFRNDIDSDKSRPLYYKLSEYEDDKLLIDYIGAARPKTSAQSNIIQPKSPVAAFVILGIVALIVAVTTALVIRRIRHTRNKPEKEPREKSPRGSKNA